MTNSTLKDSTKKTPSEEAPAPTLSPSTRADGDNAPEETQALIPPPSSSKNNNNNNKNTTAITSASSDKTLLAQQVEHLQQQVQQLQGGFEQQQQEHHEDLVHLVTALECLTDDDDDDDKESDDDSDDDDDLSEYSEALVDEEAGGTPTSRHSRPIQRTASHDSRVSRTSTVSSRPRTTARPTSKGLDITGVVRGSKIQRRTARNASRDSSVDDNNNNTIDNRSLLTNSVVSVNVERGLQLFTLQGKEGDHLEQTLSTDTFGFLLAAKTNSSPFALGLFVLVFQVAIFSLTASNLLQPQLYPQNVFGIPANVTQAVWVAQIIAIIIAVVIQDDIRTGLDMLREGYTTSMQQAFPHSTRLKFIVSVVARFFAGSLALVVNFLLIVVSDSVIELLLNFTALAFVSNLDEVAFFLSHQGFAGKANLEQAHAMTDVVYYVPRTQVQARKACMIVSIFLAMLSGWVWVRVHQITGRYLCSTILVQFGDDMRPELGTFSGLYDIQSSADATIHSVHVSYVDRHSQQTRFAYCNAERMWTFRFPRPEEYRNDTVTEWADPCTDWKVKSSETVKFDLLADDLDWFVRDDFNRQVKLEPMLTECFDCPIPSSGNEPCSGRGTCDNAICTCDDGWFGLRCEFLEPCSDLALDVRLDGFRQAVRDLSEDFALLRNTRSSALVELYHRPVYMANYVQGHYDVVFFTGRRWAATHTGLLPLDLSGETNYTVARQEVANFFASSFHGHWSEYFVEFLSQAVDFSTPDDAATPVDKLWYEAKLKGENDVEIQSVDLSRQAPAVLLCAVCNNDTNPCLYDEYCNEETSRCECSMGSYGALCEQPPIGNGHCDHPWYNVPEFEFDGGDCCDSTCVSSADFSCGEDDSGYVNVGYYFCGLPNNRWQLQGDETITGDPLSLLGYSIALSQTGSLLAVGEPKQAKVRLYDKDGGKWILRETLEGPPDSLFGVTVSISGGPVHWRNNPNFRAPLILGVGMAEDDIDNKVLLYRCGHTKQCIQVDEFTKVHGNGFPEAFHISKDGRVMAEGLADPAAFVRVYENTKDYYHGERVLRASLEPSKTQGSEVFSVRLSEDGSVLAVFTILPSPQLNEVHVYHWNGTGYNLRGDVLYATEFEVHQRQLTLAHNGDVVAIGVSGCDHPHVPVFFWDQSTSSWAERDTPELHEYTCGPDEVYKAWSTSLNHDGDTLALAAYPDSDVATVYEWDDALWHVRASPIHFPIGGGSEIAISLSSDGAHLAIGNPFSGLNEAGSVAMYSMPIEECHHEDDKSLLRLSLTTDYDPDATRVSLENLDASEFVYRAGPYQFPTGTLVEKWCLDQASCYAFTIYNTEKGDGLRSPGRYDLFLNGLDYDRDGFTDGWAKRVHVGANCLICPMGTRMFRSMVQTCKDVTWTLTETGAQSPVFSGSTQTTTAACNTTSIDSFYWEETCIDPTKCYEFSTSKNALGYNYLLLFGDDEQVAYQSNVVGASTSRVGTCDGAWMVESTSQNGPSRRL